MTTRSRASSSSSSATAHTATTCSANEARAIHDLLVGKRATLVDALQASAQQAGLQPGKVAASTSSSALAPPTSSQLEGPGAAKDEDKSATRVDGEAMEDVSMEFDTSASISSGEQSDSGESSTTSRGGIADLGDFSNVFSFLSSGREREPSDEMEQDQDGPAGASQADDVWSALKLPRVQPYPLPTALSANALSSSGRGAKAQARAERGVEQHRDREDNAPMNDDAAAPGQGEKEHLERSSRALRNAKRPGKRERERMRAAAAAATAETADPPAEVQSSAREPPRPVAARERQEAMSLARTVSEDAAAPLPSGMDGSARKAEGVERHGKKSYKEGGPLLRLRRDSPPPCVPHVAHTLALVSDMCGLGSLDSHVSLPLSLSDKSRSLPEKLGHVFPHEKHSIEQAIRSGRLYAPGLAALRDNDERSTVAPPNEQAEHGFWPSIMTAQPVTSRRQCPRPVKGKDDADGDTTMASADDERASPKPVPNDFAIAEESQDEEMQAHVEIFVDNSNILYSFLNRLRDRVKHEQHHTPAKGATGKSAPVMVGGKKARMDYTTLFAVLERGRHVRRRVLAGSSPLWQGLETAVEWVSVFELHAMSPVSY